MDLPQESASEQIIQRIEEYLGHEDAKVNAYLTSLKSEVRKAQVKLQEQNESLSQFEEAYEKLTSPANRIAVFLEPLEEGQVLLSLGDQEYVALTDPKVDLELLNAGDRVKLNEAYVVIGTVKESTMGQIVKVSQVLDDSRLRIGTDLGGQSGRIIPCSSHLAKAEINVGDEVRLDPSGRIAVEHFIKNESADYFVEEKAEVHWNEIGGQEKAISLIRETLEEPLLYPELFESFEKKPVKGILLYGPPGCGKTLIGKAVAWNLAQDYAKKTGKENSECFLHISGPKILNMWLGESERIVREIFATAREKAKSGQLVVIFIDEADSILRTRSGGRWMNISNTVVPQFCAEMDGMQGLENVVLILTSNRPDYIDPAIMRPERIDRKVKINRPDMESAKEIFSLYVSQKLPIDPEFSKQHDGNECARLALIEGTLAYLNRENSETEFLQVRKRNGESEIYYWKDLLSGALIKSVVDRAKDFAIRRAIHDKDNKQGLKLSDFEEALKAEYSENEIFPKSDSVEDWLKLLDIDPEQVVDVKPVGQSRGETFFDKGVI